jgi:hypothetical protein
MKHRSNIYIPIYFRISALLIVTFIIPFQVILQQPLMSITKYLILSIQHRRTSEGITFFSLYQYFGNGQVLIFVAPGIFNFFHPYVSAPIIIFCSLIHYFGNFLALVLQEERPFWYSSRIKSELCSLGYGNPSLPILISATLLPIVFIELFHTLKLRYYAYGLLIAVLILSSLSGIYVADNFPHQAVTSLFFAFALVTGYFSLYREVTTFCKNSCFNYGQNRIYLMYWLLLTFGSILIVGVLQIIINVVPAYYPKLVANATTYCSENYKPNGTDNERQCLDLFYTLGFVYGNMITCKRLSLYWMVTEWWKRIVRYVLCILINISISYGFRSIPTNDSFSTAVFHYVIPNFLMGISYTCALPMILKRTPLIAYIRPGTDDEPILQRVQDKTTL